MKINKETKVIAEEVEFEAGAYYWEDNQLNFYKISVNENEDFENYVNFKMERLTLSGNIWGIRVEEDYDDMENLPYAFKEFIIGGQKRKITEEEFNKEKQEILNRI
jgi:hypothetical protein